ncbi:MAG: large subunit ribosomal protein L23 [Candidatus Tokpelaia sp. JSC188]|nr:MAG: large subunit ribosomal protein L23 [Candidatus Tokpelaia sp. JSC188]
MDIRYYDTIINPVITEKSTMISENNQVIFNVAPKATKSEIKEAVEILFGVKVKAVNTFIRKGKEKRFKGISGRQSNIKRAILSLAEDQSIDFSTDL